jgi:hypothetical protein
MLKNYHKAATIAAYQGNPSRAARPAKRGRGTVPHRRWSANSQSAFRNRKSAILNACPQCRVNLPRLALGAKTGLCPPKPMKEGRKSNIVNFRPKPVTAGHGKSRLLTPPPCAPCLAPTTTRFHSKTLYFNRSAIIEQPVTASRKRRKSIYERFSKMQIIQ